ncbi:MAG TPA: DUF4280 domain-containing protein [Acidimicrobiia bacterium]|nr:DUF4280 domain-containing protein [Acidimicrobiia bacterium]
MGQLVCTGATITCNFGAAPAVLNALPISRAVVGGLPVATITDSAPFVNIPSFGTCISLGNPTVAAATAAALGALTPMVCMPATGSPWVPGSPTALVGGKPALSNNSTCQCAYGGVITVGSPGQTQTQIP